MGGSSSSDGCLSSDSMAAAARTENREGGILSSGGDDLLATFLTSLDMELKHQLGLLCVILLLPALSSATNKDYCPWNPYKNSRATYYGTRDGYGTPRGACGFGEYGRTVNDGMVAAVSGLWNDGVGCGACYQVKCKVPKLCNVNGVTVVATDYGQGDRTDFILSPRAFNSLGVSPDASKELKKYGTLDIAYKRVPCTYPGRNIVVKVQESSSNPGYFAVVLQNLGGSYDVTNVELWEDSRKQWSPLRRVYGAVFDYANPPKGQLFLRFQVIGCYGTYWQIPKKPIPADWKPKMTYDTGLQLK
ncbi:expansin-like B1 [Arachis stenosperma]|uniref:expansin-like B1 n=1 Tax=Arachis stenosperma TaxID=217475 RepID=UPI0025ACCB9E|nr:expansin-like B1 [Arachis stenosperma]